MTNEEAIKFLRQLYPNGGHCWLDEQRIEAISMAVKALQEEPVSKDFEMALAEMVAKAQKCVVEPWVVAAQWKDELIKLAKSEEPVSEDLEKVSYYFACMCHPSETAYSKTSPNPDVIKALKAGAKWQKAKDESTTEDLGEYINELSKQFPEVSFAKLSRIAVRAAKWQKEKMMAKAIDAEVKVDAGGYPYIDKTIELYDYDKDVPLAKEGDKYKVVLIKED